MNFNKKVPTKKTVNKCGAPAYSLSKKEELVSATLTSFFGEQKFYGDTTPRLIELAEETDIHFVASLAGFARNVMNMRSVSHALCAVVAHNAHNFPDGAQVVYKALDSVVVRGDDITEIITAYAHMYGKPFPNSLRRGLAKQMNKMSEFQFSKYGRGNQTKKEFTFADVLRICHPTPKSAEQSRVFNEIMTGNLPVPDTWETQTCGKNTDPEVWKRLIFEGKMGVMAILRELTHILPTADRETRNKIAEILSDPEKIKKSRQLPFRFFTAYRAVSQSQFSSTKILDALEDAIAISASAVPTIPGRTLIAIDVSGSMGCHVSGKSEVRCADIARVMGAIATRICEDADVYSFDESIRKINLSSRNGIISNAESIRFTGGGTDISLAMQTICDRKDATYDRLILLSDNESNSGWRHRHEGWNSRARAWVRTGTTSQHLATEYRKTRNPNFWVHCIDLAGYGTTQLTGDKTDLLSGWSEAIFQFISLRESGEDTLVKRIENYL